MPTAQSILKAVAEKNSGLSAILMQSEQLGMVDDLLKQAFSEAVRQAKEEVGDILREANVEEKLVKLIELNELAVGGNLSVNEWYEVVEQRKQVKMKELQQREAQLKAVQAEIEELRRTVLVSQKRRADFV
jgi:hypothetical protein